MADLIRGFDHLSLKTMNKTPNDGEPAFPVPVGEREFWDREENGSPNGITIRDYFAAAAMQGMIASGEYLAKQLHKNSNKNMGDMAYMAADEMLAAREHVSKNP